MYISIDGVIQTLSYVQAIWALQNGYIKMINIFIKFW